MDSTTHLREQVMINQFVSASGCTRDHAQNLLKKSNWELERALSMFFQDGPLYSSNPNHLLQNTPATPDSFPDILNQFSSFKLNGQSNSNTSSTNSSNQANSLDSKTSSISPLVSHIQHHYHYNFNPSSNNLVMRNMK